MAKINPFILLAGGAAALYFVSQKKASKKDGASGDPKEEASPAPTPESICRAIPVGNTNWGEIYDNLTAFYKSEEASDHPSDLPFGLKQAIRMFEIQYIEPMAQSVPENFDQLSSHDRIALLTDRYNKAFPACGFDQGEALALITEADESAHGPQLILELDARESLFLIAVDLLFMAMYKEEAADMPQLGLGIR